MSNDPLNLKSLETRTPPEGLWQSIADEMDEQGSLKAPQGALASAPESAPESASESAPESASESAPWWRVAANNVGGGRVVDAIAASLLVAVGAIYVADLSTDQTAEAPFQMTESTEKTIASPGDSLSRLKAVSTALQQQLSGWQGGVSSGEKADAIARMERELEWLDLQLEQQPEEAVLWAERVALLSEMNQAYASTDWRAELMLATF